MAKARKNVRKTAGASRKAAGAQGKPAASRKKVATSKAASGSRKATGTKKARAGKPKRGTRPPASDPTKLDLRGLKKQIREHVEKLQGARTGDARVTEALASLQRAYSELESSCGTTMVIPLA